MAGNINRVVLVGNLTRDPELRHTPSGTPSARCGSRCNTRRKDESGPVDGQAELLRHHRLGVNRARTARSTSRRDVPSRSTAASSGASGRRRTARSDRPSRSSPRASSSSAAARTRKPPTFPPGATAGRRRLPDLPCRRRHSVLGESRTWHRRNSNLAAAPARPTAPGKRKSCHFCRDKVQEIDYKNLAQLRRYISEKGKIRSRRITGACRRHQIQVAVAVKRHARWLSSRTWARRWRSFFCTTSRSSACVGGRRGRARVCAQLPPPAQGSPRTPHLVASPRSAGSTRSGRSTRRARRSRRRRLPRRWQDRAPLRGQGRPDRLALRLGDTVRRRRRDLARTQGSGSTAARSRSTRSSGSALLGADRALPGRARRGEDARRSEGASSRPRRSSLRSRRRRPSGGSGAAAVAAAAASTPRPRPRSPKCSRGGRGGRRRRGRRRGRRARDSSTTDASSRPTTTPSGGCLTSARRWRLRSPHAACSRALPRRAAQPARPRRRASPSSATRSRRPSTTSPRAALPGNGLDLRSDAVVCRRLVADELLVPGCDARRRCSSRRRARPALGPIVVINVGYNDWAAVYDVDRVMKASRRRASSTWSGSLCARRARMRRSTRSRTPASAAPASAGEDRLVIADWNAYSRGKPWFREDGLHLTSSGAFGSRTCSARSSSPASRARSCPQPLWKPRKFALGARCFRLTTSPRLSTGHPPAGITWERMFCSPCTGTGVASVMAQWTRRPGRLDSRAVTPARLQSPRATAARRRRGDRPGTRSSSGSGRLSASSRPQNLEAEESVLGAMLLSPSRSAR
jgi:small subunit ribosomal protein S18